jgi:single-strand DNA-binding protein
MASRSLNKVTLIGNLTRDPELRYTPQGTAVAQFGLATNRDWTTAQGERKEEVQYHRIIAWSKLAELCSQLLAKGSKVYVEGRIVYRSFEGKDKVQRNITEIVMDNMIVLFGKSAGTRVAAGGESTAPVDTISEPVEEDLTEAPEKKTKAAKGKKTVEPEPELPESEEVSEDEIPF